MLTPNDYARLSRALAELRPDELYREGLGRRITVRVVRAGNAWPVAMLIWARVETQGGDSKQRFCESVEELRGWMYGEGLFL